MSKSSLDHTLGALCKDDDTRRLAKAYFTLVRTLRPGEDTVNLPKGVECVCVWFATERYVPVTLSIWALRHPLN